MFTDELKLLFLSQIAGATLTDVQKAYLLFLVEQYMKVAYNEGVGDLPAAIRERKEHSRSRFWRGFSAGVIFALLVAMFVLRHP